MRENHSYLKLEMAAGRAGPRAGPGRDFRKTRLARPGRAAISKFYKLFILFKELSIKITIECLHEICYKIYYLNSYPLEILNLITILHKIILII